MSRSNKNWTEEEEVFLKNYYPDTDYGELSLALNRSIGAIKTKAFRLGLKRSERVASDSQVEDKMTPQKQRILDEINRVQTLKKNTGEETKVCISCNKEKPGWNFSFSNRDLARVNQCRSCRQKNSSKHKHKRILEGRDW